uniref:Uncharacterized protein n=1 Tax=Anguilla anguilla TaxID=7936 RepID=A0A0E9TFP0_ANGAN
MDKQSLGSFSNKLMISVLVHFCEVTTSMHTTDRERYAHSKQQVAGH